MRNMIESALKAFLIIIAIFVFIGLISGGIHVNGRIKINTDPKSKKEIDSLEQRIKYLEEIDSVRSHSEIRVARAFWQRVDMKQPNSKDWSAWYAKQRAQTLINK